MKTPEIRNPQWDAYRAFHCVRTDRDGLKIVQFDTGELLVQCHGNPRPDARQRYDDLDVSVWATGDSELPALTLTDGANVPVTWLQQQSAQTLLIDHGTGHVVRLDGTHNDYKSSHDPRIPVRFRSVSGAITWFAGAGCPPVAPRTVRVSAPTRYTVDEQRHARSLQHASIAWWAIVGNEYREYYTKLPYTKLPVLTSELVAVPSFARMPDALRIQCATQPLTAGRTVTEHTHLLLAK